MDLNIVVSVSAVLVAVIALVTSIWQGVISRQHNKLSVRPHLVLEHFQYEGVTNKIVLRNNGLGPAIIKEIEVFIDDEKIVGNGGSMKAVINKLGLKLAQYEFYHPSPDEGFPANYPKNLMSFILEGDSDHDRTVLESLRERMLVKIKYESIYKDSYYIEGIG